LQFPPVDQTKNARGAEIGLDVFNRAKLVFQLDYGVPRNAGQSGPGVDNTETWLLSSRLGADRK
jgi:hypothetical protein